MGLHSAVYPGSSNYVCRFCRYPHLCIVVAVSIFNGVRLGDYRRECLREKCFRKSIP